MPGVAVPDDDPYLWLESLDSPAVARWVADRNAETLAELGGESFVRRRDSIREVLDNKDHIPWPGWRGDGLYYNFWTDADHPRGLWRRPRRTSIASTSQRGTSCSTSTR